MEGKDRIDNGDQMKPIEVLRYDAFQRLRVKEIRRASCLKQTG
ncbi:hypothetical protein PO124_28920 [Bacillus licheniformis]|nr:hypothetical protein [Bacillus licheniformis]